MSQLFKKLGYPNKQAYFSSDQFKQIKSDYLEANPICKNCGKNADTLYFIEHTMSNLKGDSYDGIIPLCNKCHTQCVASINKADSWMKKRRMSRSKKRR